MIEEEAKRVEEALEEASNESKPLRLRVERGPDSMIGNAQPFGLPTKFTFATAARFWFDRRPEFNYRITAIEIEEVR